jgi:hypothetical protein
VGRPLGGNSARDGHKAGTLGLTKLKTLLLNIFAYTYDLVKHRFAAEYRGMLETKGRDELNMYYVVGSVASGERDF